VGKPDIAMFGSRIRAVFDKTSWAIIASIQHQRGSSVQAQAARPILREHRRGCNTSVPGL